MKIKMRNPCSYKLYAISFIYILNICLPTTVWGNLYQFRTNLQKLSAKQLAALRHKREIPAKYGGEINNLSGKSGEGYYIEVEIGTPKQKLNIIVDTGSSNFAVACEENKELDTYFQRDQSSTYKDLGRKVNVPYTQGSWNGILGQDYITISSLPNSTVYASIACITHADGFFINGSNWQGIMGLGYAAIARPDSSVKPLYDSMVEAQLVDNWFSVELCGLRFKSPNPEEVVGGSILFGGSDPSLYKGALYSTPLNKEWYYEVIIVDVGVNGKSLNMDCKEYNFGKTIVDTGTTNLRLPARVFNNLAKKMKKFVKTASLRMPNEGFWSGEEILCWKAGQVPYNDFPSVSITLPSNKTSVFTLVIAPQHYLRHVGDENDDRPENDCYKLGISSLDTGAVIGAVIMEGYYVIFDREQKQVQFAESTCIGADPLLDKSTIQGNISYTGDYKDCAYTVVDTHSETLTIVGYVMAGVCGVCLLPVILLAIHWQCRRCGCRRPKLQRANSDINDLMESS